MNPSLPSGVVGSVTWQVTKPAGMKGLVTVHFERALDAKVDAKTIAFMKANGISNYGKGARTYNLAHVLMLKRIDLAGWKEEIEKIARRFERT